ncbi:HEAT repeat domain-containing protein [Halarcobacter bivalviorum]|uniref:HEAT repeat domain-containing protein n=1 Tax=Halarcobacter bivalviorum TaxID=663364 RepID=UPI00100B3E74|nr:HEAT repeat domain-containing protein [Halarcobacter bivalviorum]RXK07280.1 hypothetical protein CRU97_04000 [Halarcobacter bivalviorum]
MKKGIKSITQIFTIFAVVLFFQACSLKVPIKSTEKSENKYEPSLDVESKAIKEVSFINALDKDATIITGEFKENIHLEYKKEKLEASSFIKNALQEEFKARALPISIIDTSLDSLNLENFEIFVYRSSGFSPVVTFSSLRVTVQIGDKKETFVSIVKRGKVPVWVVDEIFDPCFNEPISLMIKEIVAKINKAYFNYKISDEKVSEIMLKIDKGVNNDDKLNYLNIYELGFSNNPKALELLKQYTNNSDEYLRLASLSMLGFLGGESEFDYLVSKYRNSKIWQDRALSMKAIADINTEKTKKFLQNEYKLWKAQDSKEAIWNVMLLDILKVND